MRLAQGILSLMLAGVLGLLILLWAPGLWGYEIYTVSSGSMEPEIRVGDALFVKQIPFHEIREGDVITYTPNGGSTVVTHRVIRIETENNLIQTKGDANTQIDSKWIEENQILGKAEVRIRYLGMIAYILSTGSGKLLCGAIVLWILAAQMILDGCQIMGSRKKVRVY